MICNRKCFILVVSALVLLFTSFACICFSKTLYTNMQYSQIEVIFNCCNAHEKKGEDFVENSDHDIESGIYDANGIYSDFYVEGYKHIHCLVPKTYGGYYCAAIGNNGLKYLLSLNVKMKVVSFVEVSNLPAKMFANNDSLIAYYISDGAASLYKIDFENSEIGILVDDISIANSGNAKLIGSIYKDTEEYFNLYEYEYQRYLESGEDLLYTLFDEKCFESVYVQNNSIVYRTNKSDEVPKWIVKDNLGESAFFNEDRCFGFIGERTLLFYRCIHLGLFDIGMFYKYDYAQGRKFDNRIVFNRGIIQGEISDNKEKFYFSSSVTEGVIFYCMDLKTGIYNEVLDDVEYRGRFCVLNKT